MKYTQHLLLSLIWLSSCKQQIHSDIKYERYENGRLKSIKNYKMDVLNGQAQWFYPDGKIEQTVVFENGKENGNAYYFYPSGALKNFRYWREGKMIGYVNDFYDDTVGIIKSVLIYNNAGDLTYKKNFDSLGHFVSEEGTKPKPE